MKRIFIYIIPLILGVGCMQKKTTPNDDQDKQDVTKMEIVVPTPPAILGAEEERAEYIVNHYWDNFDFRDTTYMSLPDITEQAFANYLYIMQAVPEEKVEGSINKMLDASQVEPLMYGYFTDLFERYLDEEGSPMRSENIYIYVLRHMLASDVLDEYEKIRPEARLKMALKNRVGDKAQDFVITLANGSKIKLYNIKAEFTLLYINNPDCSACAAITNDINSSQMINSLIQGGRLKIVAVYPDEDLQAWRNHQVNMPSSWINGYDAELAMRDKQIYDIRAIPTLYLLDKNKTVLLKDVADAADIEKYFYFN